MQADIFLANHIHKLNSIANPFAVALRESVNGLFEKPQAFFPGRGIKKQARLFKRLDAYSKIDFEFWL